MIYLEIGLLIRDIRKSQGMSARELAEKIGLKSAQAILQYERGERQIGIEQLKKIADALNVNIRELLGADHAYNDITTNYDKYCTDITYSSDYTIEESQELINIYFNGIKHWTNDKLFSDAEKRVLNEHFCEVLIRYKSLVECILKTKISFNSNEKNIYQYSKTLSNQLTSEQLKALYFGNNADSQLNDLTRYIQFLPVMFSNSNTKEGE